ncbi:light-harvesting protein [Rhodoblastus sphagnicola]|uniref:Antenna pigment protein alpha chain n=1 Tax=Rhodoblastus sphagnicola TaxID=333368 RepID=A0A2S6N591_9HYPH|nr:light-harvesting protein [Rhodoblastus sphagnicola]MBB4197178.1 light-harvesting protein B-800-850 alpha chain [Rhodoblastus sphagnicola]PPQ29793.1 light-harvesting protein [Rhodoblastus sphagnicola]
MNQGKIWTVVNPSVGLPLLLGSVAVTALLVHYAVLTHTTWVAAYFQGGTKKAAAVEHMQAPVASLPSNVSVN